MRKYVSSTEQTRHFIRVCECGFHFENCVANFHFDRMNESWNKHSPNAGYWMVFALSEAES